MKNIFTLLLLFAGIACGQLQGPKMYSPSTSFDFGTIKQGAVVKHSFALMNNGDDTLKISNVVTSCGCTAADLPQKEILPGKTVYLGIEFNSTGREGLQVKYISVASNDKTTPMMQLVLRGTVEPGPQGPSEAQPAAKIEFTENQYDFGIAAEGTVLEHIFQFSNTGNLDLEIKNVQTSCGCTAALVSQKVVKPGERGTIKVKFDTANRFGRMSRTITITTNEPVTPMKTLTVYADITKKDSN